MRRFLSDSIRDTDAFLADLFCSAAKRGEPPSNANPFGARAPRHCDIAQLCRPRSPRRAARRASRHRQRRGRTPLCITRRAPLRSPGGAVRPIAESAGRRLGPACPGHPEAIAQQSSARADAASTPQEQAESARLVILRGGGWAAWMAGTSPATPSGRTGPRLRRSPTTAAARK